MNFISSLQNTIAMDERLINAFAQLNVGNDYSRNKLDSILNYFDLSGNITALTVNRWNKGMSLRDYESILFEYISTGEYKYLGPNHNYSGNTYLYRGNTPYLLVGTWNKGKFKFAIPEIKSFLQWKEANFPGILLCENGNRYRILRVVDAGHGNRRLGLTSADHNENQGMAPAKKVLISLTTHTNNYINIRAIPTYVNHGSISHREVNRWIIDNHFELGGEFKFEFCVVEGETHIYQIHKMISGIN